MMIATLTKVLKQLMLPQAEFSNKRLVSVNIGNLEKKRSVSMDKGKGEQYKSHM